MSSEKIKELYYEITLEITDQVRKNADSVNKNDIIYLIDLIIQSKNKKNKVFIYGAGRSGFIGRCFAQRLMHLGIVSCFISDAVTYQYTKEDLLILISGSGETISPIAFANKAKDESVDPRLGGLLGDSGIQATNMIADKFKLDAGSATKLIPMLAPIILGALTRKRDAGGAGSSARSVSTALPLALERRASREEAVSLPSSAPATPAISNVRSLIRSGSVKSPSTEMPSLDFARPSLTCPATDKTSPDLAGSHVVASV